MLDNRTIRGAAVCFRQPFEDAGEWFQFAPRAFDEWLQSPDSRKVPVQVLHNPAIRLGVRGYTEFTRTLHDLRVQFALARGGPNDNVLLAVQHGYFPQMSIEYRTLEAEPVFIRGVQIMEITRAEIGEVSLADFGRVPGTWATTSSRGCQSARDRTPFIRIPRGFALEGWLKTTGWRNSPPKSPAFPMPASKPTARPATKATKPVSAHTQSRRRAAETEALLRAFDASWNVATIR